MRLSIPVVSDKKVGLVSSVAWGSVRGLCQGGWFRKQHRLGWVPEQGSLCLGGSASGLGGRAEAAARTCCAELAGATEAAVLE